MTSTPPTSFVVLINGRVACQDLRVRLKGRPLPIGHSALDHVPSDYLSDPHGDLLALVVCEHVGSVCVRGKMGHWFTIPVHAHRYLIALTSNVASLSISMGSTRAQCLAFC